MLLSLDIVYAPIYVSPTHLYSISFLQNRLLYYAKRGKVSDRSYHEGSSPSSNSADM